MKNFIIGVVFIAIAVAIGVFAGSKVLNLGASPGPEHYNLEYFYGGLVNGGNVSIQYLTTLTSNKQLTANDFCNNSFLSFAAGTSSPLVLYTPNASQMQKCLGQVGAWKTIFIDNFSTTSGAGYTLTATGTTMVDYATGTSASIPANGGRARVDFVATTSASVLFFVSPF